MTKTSGTFPPLQVGDQLTRCQGQLLQQGDQQLHRTASLPGVEPVTSGQTSIESVQEWYSVLQGQARVPGVLAHLLECPDQGSLGSRSLDSLQVLVDLGEV